MGQISSMDVISPDADTGVWRDRAVTFPAPIQGRSIYTDSTIVMTYFSDGSLIPVVKSACIRYSGHE